MVVNLSAHPLIGQKYYLKFMSPSTEMKGNKFAIIHTMAEWEELFEGDGEKFAAEFTEKYPDLKEFFEGEIWPKVRNDIKDFCIEFAADSGKVPSC